MKKFMKNSLCMLIMVAMCLQPISAYAEEVVPSNSNTEESATETVETETEETEEAESTKVEASEVLKTETEETENTNTETKNEETKNEEITETEISEVEVAKAETLETSETMKVYFDNSVTNWNKVMVYVGDKGAGWPGSAMALTEDKDNVWEAEVPKDIELLIFNNNQEDPKQQSQDIKGEYIVADGEYIAKEGSKSGSKWTVLRKGENGELVEEVVPMQTIYFDNSKTNWEIINVHYWGGGETTWPGLPMEATDKENIYQLKVPVGITGMVFNNIVNNEGDRSFDVNDIKDGATYVAVDFDAAGKWAVCRADKIPQQSEEATDEQKKARQVNTHVGADYDTVYLSFTTAAEVESKVVVRSESGEEMTFTGEHAYSYVSESYKHKIVLSGLKPSTQYTYTIGEENYEFAGSFKTIPAKGSNETLKFAFLADTQVSNEVNAKAAGATFAQLNEIDNLGFVYIGGDITDNADNKLQWEQLFENSGAYATAGIDCLSNHLLAVTQGNHDKNYNNSSLSSYINAPAEAGDLVYSIDYGKVKFVVLNLETAKESVEVRDQQKNYLEQEVAEAKKNGQWIIVGFHKSIYTGASHIVDSDVKEARKFWSPVLAGLDVDVVLEAHDHVYARGFINGDGTRSEVEKDSTGAYISKDNAPLYMVGGHAGGLKWYSKKEYTVEEGDPLLPNYEFLDVNSTDGENGSNVSKEQVYTIFEVSDTELKSTTYMFKYDTDSDTITTAPYVFDSVTIKRNTATEEPKQPQQPIENNQSSENTATQESSTQTPAVENVSATLNTINDVETPMAETIVEAGGYPYANIQFGKNKAVLKLEALQKYHGRNVYLMAHLGNGIGYTITNEALGSANTDLSLESSITKVAGFAADFETFRVKPVKETQLTYQVGLHMNVGAEYAGKTTYLFSKNLETNEYELSKVTTVNEIGNVGLLTDDITEVMVLIQK